jgi:hypothetical protein
MTPKRDESERVRRIYDKTAAERDVVRGILPAGLSAPTKSLRVLELERKEEACRRI